MGKAFALLILLFLLFLASGCTSTSNTGKLVESTELTAPDNAQAPVQENIDELHKEFAEFEKSQEANASEKNETQEEAASAENPEGTQAENNITQEETTPEETVPEEAVQNQSVQACPSCDDNDSCTADSCSESTGYECVYEPITPCCGNGKCEEGENWTTCRQDCECSLECGPCETLDTETCSCVPKTECVPDGCCPANCTYLEDSDCPKPSIVFSEINYNPEGNDDNHEWVEIYNNGTVEVNISKWRLEEGGQQHILTASGDSVIAPSSFAIIADNATQFLDDYPGFSGLLFRSAFSLSNSGETIALRIGKDGEIADSVSYNSTWGGDGDGFTLEKIDLNGPNSQENWNGSITQKGTPGLINSISP